MQQIIEIYGLSLRTWPLLLVVGVGTAWLLVLRRTRALGYPRGEVFRWLALAFPAGAAGGGLVAALLEQTSEPAWDLMAGGGGGLTSLGALLGCLGFSALWIRWRFRESPWELLDAAAFSLPLALAFGRLGCLANGCCFGKVADGPFAASPIVTVGAAAYEHDCAAGVYAAGLDGAARLWNLPLALLLNAGVALILIEALYRNRKRLGLPAGTVLLTGLTALGFGRWAFESLRGPSGRVGNPWADLSLAVALAAGVGCLWLFHEARKQRPGRSDSSCGSP